MLTNTALQVRRGSLHGGPETRPTGRSLIVCIYSSKRSVPDQIRNMSQVGTSSYMAYAM